MSIREHLNKIRNAIYGREVREAIAKGIEETYNDASEKHDNANMEVKMARGTHSNLNNRLDDMEETDQEVTAQLAQTESELNALGTEKMDKNTTDISFNQINKNKKLLDESFLSETLKAQITGTAPIGPVPADNSITNNKLSNDSVTYSKLSESFMFDLSTNLLNTTDDLNFFIKTGSFFAEDKPINAPKKATQGGSIHVFATSSYHITQIYHEKTGATYVRRKTSSVFTEWAHTLTHEDNVSLRKYPNLGETDDLNSLLTDGRWMAVGAKNTPENNITWMVDVKTFKTSLLGAQVWGWQTATGAYDVNRGKVYMRSFVILNDDITFYDWVDMVNAPAQGVLKGKDIVVLGDSIIGNNRGAESVTANMANKTGATVHNAGFGGSRMSEHETYWDAFSIYRLADEIVKDNSDPTKWTYQDEAIQAQVDGIVGLGGLPSYFPSQLEKLKDVDWERVDYLVIASGTNDYAAGSLIENSEDLYDTTTFAGALRQSLEKIMGVHKHLKILVCTPMIRFFGTQSSDTREYNGQTLPDFVQKEIEIANEYKTPISNTYFELGINKFNRQEYFPPTDGTHPNAEGNKKLGEKIASDLISKF